jgi:drug/metabolite transporter (DMT)-like permease
MTFSKTLWPAIVVVALVRAISFVFTVLGKEPSKESKFLLSLLSSVGAVLATGHGQSIQQFTEALTAVFAASQALYNTAKRFVGVIRSLSRE